jgi:hypothetical protein
VIDGKSDLSLSIAGVTTGTFYVQEMLHLLVSESACMQVVLGVTAPIILCLIESLTAVEVKHQ